jgi:hypothetical protein
MIFVARLCAAHEVGELALGFGDVNSHRAPHRRY